MGPFDVTFTAIAIIKNNGSKQIKPINDAKISKDRLPNDV
jgi:hypothetical protein